LEGINNAFSSGHSCPQPRAAVAEDCLFLNVRDFDSAILSIVHLYNGADLETTKHARQRQPPGVVLDSCEPIFHRHTEQIWSTPRVDHTQPGNIQAVSRRQSADFALGLRPTMIPHVLELLFYSFSLPRNCRYSPKERCAKQANDICFNVSQLWFISASVSAYSFFQELSAQYFWIRKYFSLHLDEGLTVYV
jgi:hypothetical protein